MTPETLMDWGAAILRTTGALFIIGIFVFAGVVLASTWIDFIRRLRGAQDATLSSGPVALFGTLVYIGAVLWIIGAVWQGGAR